MKRHITPPALLLATLLAIQSVWADEAEHGHHAADTTIIQQIWGIAGHTAQVSRNVEIRMGDDMRFSPERLQVRLGETIRFVHHNDGRLMHEFVLGTQETLDAHAAQMLAAPGMRHGEPYMVHVSPQASEEMIWTFNRAGEFEFACLIAGHYQSGMRGTIEVLAE